MKQKLFILFLALAASVGTIFAESGTCGDNLTWDLTDGVLTISGTGAMSVGTYDLNPWFKYIESITQLVITDGVTSIDGFAFSYCSGLTTVTIPASVTTIEIAPFFYCFSLKEILVDAANPNYLL